VTYVPAAGDPWSLTYVNGFYSLPATIPALAYEAVGLDRDGHVLLGMSLSGAGEKWGHAFGASGEERLVLARLSPREQLEWAQEFQVQGGHVESLAVAPDGSVVMFATFHGEARFFGEVLASPPEDPSSAGQALVAVAADGSPRWVRPLATAASPLRFLDAAVVVSSEGLVGLTRRMLGEQDLTSCGLLELRTFTAAGVAQDTWPLGTPDCQGSVDGTLAFVAGAPVVAGAFSGTVTFLPGLTTTSAEGLEAASGFLLRLPGATSPAAGR